MSIASLTPAYNKKARVTALNYFASFLETENMTLTKTHEQIDGDKTARATDKSRSTNTGLAYYGNVKNWLLGMYPQQGSIVKPQLQKVLAGFEKFSNNREGGSFEKKSTTVF
ncbi:hypothetical protein PHMEG_00025678 [Phytophthora megakarya]|uniref:Uncharacterized protein n=1 Tax=Phytophthora megakarya TaxID=4795 RepID=A0A225VCX8_9STRA|nr:hypothetical protein PHMEG_00025678 [Phytophthora megakarya]